MGLGRMKKEGYRGSLGEEGAALYMHGTSGWQKGSITTPLLVRLV